MPQLQQFKNRSIKKIKPTDEALPVAISQRRSLSFQINNDHLAKNYLY